MDNSSLNTDISFDSNFGISSVVDNSLDTIGSFDYNFFGDSKPKDFYSRLLGKSVGSRNGLNIFTKFFTSGRNINHNGDFKKAEKLAKVNDNVRKIGNTFVKKLSNGIEIVYELDFLNRVVGKDYIIPTGEDNEFLVLNFPLKQAEMKKDGKTKKEDIYDFLSDNNEEIKNLDAFVKFASRASVVKYNVEKNRFDTVDVKSMNLIANNYNDDSVELYNKSSLPVENPLIYNQILYNSGIIKGKDQLLSQLSRINVKGEPTTYRGQLRRFFTTGNTDGFSIYDNNFMKFGRGLAGFMLLFNSIGLSVAITGAIVTSGADMYNNKIDPWS